MEYRRSGTNWRAASPVSPSSTTSTLLEALDAGNVYEVRIRAVSAIGNGTWSRVESETTYRSKLCNEFKQVIALSIMYVTKCLRTIITLVNFANRAHHKYFWSQNIWLHKELYMYRISMSYKDGGVYTR